MEKYFKLEGCNDNAVLETNVLGNLASLYPDY